MTASSGCCTGFDVMEWGRLQIASGRADMMVVGASEAPLFPFSFASFCALHILSTRNDEPERASRPYDAHRDGIVLSEGGAAIVIEEREHAENRGARVLARVLGYASAAEGGDILRPDPEGRAITSAILAALQRARLDPEDIDYIGAHGVGTPEYDLCETRAFKAAFGPRIYNIPVSSIKSMTGQALAAGGALQIAAACMTLQEGYLPPTINLDTPDPECDLDYVPHRARRARVRHLVMNAHSVGGTHSVLVLGANHGGQPA
jgi:3-oxoacyl-[acyl-carrier-protein] synthase II